MVNRHQTIRIGIIGMGGFAGEHHDSLLELETGGQCKLICTCDPAPDQFAARMSDWRFQERGIQVYSHYKDMLDSCHDQLDMVTIPTPIPLHAEMHAEVIRHSLTAYLEKPPTLDPEEFDQMMQVERNAVKDSNVGFNFTIEQPRQVLKRRLLAGDFGRLRKVVFCGLWPRSRQYFLRAPWAGRLRMDNRLVLDSCIGNALSHYIHSVLFWAGTKSLYDWADVAEVKAELYRAHAIEGTDTVFIQGTTTEGTQIQIAATHACQGSQNHYEQLVCEKATITYVTNKQYQIDWNDGTSERSEIHSVTLTDNLIAYLAYLSGQTDRPPNRLADTRPFVELNALAYIASGRITQVSSPQITTYYDESGSQEYVAIELIHDAFDRFIHQEQFPSEQNLYWARAGGTATIGELSRLRRVISKIIESGSV